MKLGRHRRVNHQQEQQLLLRLRLRLRLQVGTMPLSPFWKNNSNILF